MSDGMHTQAAKQCQQKQTPQRNVSAIKPLSIHILSFLKLPDADKPSYISDNRYNGQYSWLQHACATTAEFYLSPAQGILSCSQYTLYTDEHQAECIPSGIAYDFLYIQSK